MCRVSVFLTSTALSIGSPEGVQLSINRKQGKHKPLNIINLHIFFCLYFSNKVGLYTKINKLTGKLHRTPQISLLLWPSFIRYDTNTKCLQRCSQTAVSQKFIQPQLLSSNGLQMFFQYVTHHSTLWTVINHRGLRSLDWKASGLL